MMQFTMTNHGARVPMPSLANMMWTLADPSWRLACGRCGKAETLRFREINSDHGDERWECATELGGCGATWVAEGPDA